ncbi:metallophosphoesterase [Candidatus Woesearchaeota archaeon]|nr:metallophosphoesterase [Candidatus Woesearchaeota archaeon]
MIGVISDTHDNVENVQLAVKVFKERKVDFVIHCGDVVSPLTVKHFKDVKVHFVLGNCDGDIQGLMDAADDIGCEHHGKTLDMMHENKRILAMHGNNTYELKKQIESQSFDYVLHGHTHQKKDEKSGKTRIVNPGAHYWMAENTVALIDVKNDSVEFIQLK